MCEDDSPFYLTTNPKYASSGVWYRQQPMGVNKLATIMKVMSTKYKGGLQGRKTNHTARKTSVESLCRAEFQDSEVMQFTGHRNVSSLNAYKKPCLQQQRKMSETLSAMYSGGGRPEEIQKQPSAIKPTALSGVFSGAHLDGCTLNFNMYTGDEYGVTSSTMHYHQHRGKKRVYIIESDSEDDRLISLLYRSSCYCYSKCQHYIPVHIMLWSKFMSNREIPFSSVR